MVSKGCPALPALMGVVGVDLPFILLYWLDPVHF